MKRLLLILALSLVPTMLLAEVANRDVLLTPDGTLYTIESALNDGSYDASVMLFLRLTIQQPNMQAQTTIVPESLTAGAHSHAALAYDSESKTLFVFWLNMPNPMSSELLLSSYRDGTWQPAVSVENHAFHLEYNLRIKTSHRTANDPLLVHAVWWEETGDGETARYGLFVVEKGEVSSIYLDDLNNFLPPSTDRFDVAPNFNREILRHPALIDNGTTDSIDVIFGNVNTNAFNRITLQPIVQGRIHIPIGSHGGSHFAAPKSFTEPWSGPISTIVAPHDDSMLLYNTGKGAVSYIVYSGDTWSAVKSVPLSDKLSADAAVAVLTRMMTQ